MSRRHFLRGTGVALALPFLDTMRPVFAAASASDSPLARNARPRRFFAICNNLGVLPPAFFPTGSGRDYVASPYLELLQEHRNDFTAFSGVSFAGVDSGHPGDICFLTAAPHPSSSAFRNTISLDQFIADRIGVLTRFPSITLAVNTRSRSLSYSSTGVAVPPEDKAAEIFKQLFVQGDPSEVEAQVRQLQLGRSILDTIGERTKEVQRQASASDRNRLDEYFTSVRDLESRLHASQGWERKPKPVVQAKEPVDPANPAQYMEKVAVNIRHTVLLGGTLSGAQEVPPATTSGSGTVTATFDKATSKLSYEVVYSGLTGPARAGHFHGPAAAGQNAGVASGFADATSPIRGEVTLTAAQAADLLAGRWYVNIHTQRYPGGEIRAQVTPASR